MSEDKCRISDLRLDEREWFAECLEGEIEYLQMLIAKKKGSVPRRKSQVTAYAFVCGQLRQAD